MNKGEDGNGEEKEAQKDKEGKKMVQRSDHFEGGECAGRW